MSMSVMPKFSFCCSLPVFFMGVLLSLLFQTCWTSSLGPQGTRG